MVIPFVLVTVIFPHEAPAAEPMLVKLHSPSPRPFIVHEGSIFDFPHPASDRLTIMVTTRRRMVPMVEDSPRALSSKMRGSVSAAARVSFQLGASCKVAVASSCPGC